MKTTFDLPDELLVAAKKKAAEERCSLRDLVARGLRAELRGARRQPARRVTRIKWVTVEGALPEDLDLASRESMHHWMRRQK